MSSNLPKQNLPNNQCQLSSSLAIPLSLKDNVQEQFLSDRNLLSDFKSIYPRHENRKHLTAWVGEFCSRIIGSEWPYSCLDSRRSHRNHESN